ncbi:hypothetical protein SAMN05216548_11322 [Faunimonas pinastri]|uniref:DUF1491 family protein n=1 Tax=Faunimonas pinastri TaxID=1855383 RepID=A0A1H9MA72_9HYPH|nr:hypothetical protein SAMN05216548_11322 [Faunimonas pinastri]
MIRRAQQAGAFATIARKGASESGAIFVAVYRPDRSIDLYAPAPQAMLDDDGERRFMPVLAGADALAVADRMDSETRFDSDLWQVDIDDNEGRPFIEVIPDPMA